MTKYHEEQKVFSDNGYNLLCGSDCNGKEQFIIVKKNRGMIHFESYESVRAFALTRLPDYCHWMFRKKEEQK
jgi:ribosomal protein L24E